MGKIRNAGAIALCKIASKAGSMIGRGSSIPGVLALKIAPDILAQVEMPKAVVAVSGSNGKINLFPNFAITKS